MRRTEDFCEGVIDWGGSWERSPGGATVNIFNDVTRAIDKRATGPQ